MKRILFLLSTIIAVLMLSATVQARTCGIPIVGCCGGEGDIACIVGGCDSGLQLNAEIIPKCTAYENCGGDGQIACFGLICDDWHTINPLNWNHCIACGGEGELACFNIVANDYGCKSGLFVAQDLLCHTSCGGNGEAACWPFTCDAGNTIDPNWLDHCITCGGKDQWMCVQLANPTLPCDYPWLRAEPIAPLSLLNKCREQWNAPEPDCDCDVAVTEQADRGPVYGIADTHAHQFANMAFGGAMLWGKPYDERGINAALAWGDFTWDFATAWGFPDLPIRTIPDPFFRGLPVHFDAGAEIASLVTEEGGHFFSFDGGDSLIEWPRWSTTLHQQMYYRWLERAYKGGLRLMVMQTVNNEVICGLPISLKRVVGGGLLDPEVNCDDMYTVDRQLEEVKKMEAFIDRENDGVVNGNGWYRIVTSPHEAREAIREGKMAVVLGIEVDGLFGCETPDDCDPAWVSSELDRYYDKGVRHLFPIHLFNNGFGGSAIYNELWPYVSPLATSMLMPVIDCGFVKEKILTWGPLSDETAEYEFELSGGDEIMWFLDIIGVDLPSFIETTTGHCNFLGLTPDGQYAVKAMMDKKMLIDVDHLSLAALNEVLWEAQVRDYPLISGHSFLFERPLTEHGKPSPASEGHKTPLQIDILRDLGGMVAPLNPRKSASSTRDYVHMYRYIVDKMKKSDDDRYPGIAYASDWGAMYLQTAPRCPGPADCNIPSPPVCEPYNTENCVDSDDQNCNVYDKEDYPEAGCAGKDFPRLDYGFDGFQAVGVDGRFKKQQTGSRVFDFNKDGLAHVGLLPDFIKDLTNVGLTEEELEPLFHSAEAYIRMWEKIHGGPPVITPIIIGTEGNNGWYVSDVTVDWDIQSEATIHVIEGCDYTVIDWDTPGETLSCFVASDGGETEVEVVIKRDTVPPEAVCTASPNELWPPNQKMVEVEVATGCTDATSGPADMLINTAASNEPDSGKGKGDRPNDIESFAVGSPMTIGALRAERMGYGEGRLYTLGYTCSDMAGNTSDCETYVTVPHDMGNEP
jgi:microsomal dipeptidase-like Zn-dependent dipeptidase